MLTLHKNRSVLSSALLIVTLSGAGIPLMAAEDRTISPRYPLPALRLLTHNSGYIFGGTVKSVARIRGDPHNVATMRITFHVENAIRGVRRGQTLAIREWAGLWASGESYRVGEHVLLFMFRPGKLGLTSPVGGPFGKFKVDPYGRVLFTASQAAAIASDPAIANADSGRRGMTLREFAGGIRRVLQE